MCKVIEDMKNETAEVVKEEIALRLIKQGKLTFEQISSATYVTVDRVHELAIQGDVCCYDYTKQQHDFYDAIPNDELMKRVIKYNAENPFQGDKVIRV